MKSLEYRPAFRPDQLLTAVFLLLMWTALPTTGQPAETAEDSLRQIFLLPPLNGAAGGPAEVETLTLTPDISRLEFYLDDQQVAKRRKPPWTVRIPFAEPAREQTVRAEAFDLKGRRFGSDILVVNIVDPPLAVRIASLEPDASALPTASGSLLTAEVSVPRAAELAAVRFWLNDQLIKTLQEAPFSTRLDLPAAQADDFVRVELELVDGRIVDDVLLLASGRIEDQIDVNLVQLQTLVTEKHGSPVTGLELADFEVRQRGEPQQIARLFPAGDIALVLGLLVDTSGSMVPIWRQTQAAANAFLDGALGPRDRSFLVSFDSDLRLVQGLTGDLDLLHQALDSLEPNRDGMTALYDSILYSMLQFADQPGRRALVVLTDGFESSSRSNPKRAVEFGRKLGVPIYVVALPGGRGAAGVSFSGAVQELKLLTEPTGGRLLRVGGSGGLERAFAQISAELRHQYVLTYYTDEPPTGLGRRQIEVVVKGQPKVEVRTVMGLDSIR